MEDHSGHEDHGPEPGAAHRGYNPGGTAIPGGLSVEANGLLLEPSETRVSPGASDEWTFRILRGAKSPVTDFDEAHGERSHLIVARRDLTRFQHLHPRLDPDGTWRVREFSLPEPGVYRAFVDVVVDRSPVTLGHDLFANGEWTAGPRPGSSRTASADGYDVALLNDEVTAKGETRLRFEVRDGGRPVSRLEEYLGALGHLVALREGDLGYLHVHPIETDAEGGQVMFGANFPTRGRYRLFLQTKPDGNLITAPFDLRVER